VVCNLVVVILLAPTFLLADFGAGLPILLLPSVFFLGAIHSVPRNEFLPDCSARVLFAGVLKNDNRGVHLGGSDFGGGRLGFAFLACGFRILAAPDRLFDNSHGVSPQK